MKQFMHLSSAYAAAILTLLVGTTARAQVGHFDDNCSNGGANQWCVTAQNYSGGGGVYTSTSGAIALEGLDTAAGIGVFGSSYSGIGVEAGSTTNIGLKAFSESNYAIYASTFGSHAVHGVGNSTNGVGIFGDGEGTDTYGVNGYCNGTNCIATYGTCTGSGCVAVYAAGDLDYTGNLNHRSDERLKTDITTLQGSLDKLLRLRGVSFHWKDTAKQGGELQRGFIAQEYEKVFPEWVKVGPDGFKMIQTQGLDSLEVESIRQLKAENDDLRNRVAALEAARRPLVASNPAWGWGAGMAIAGVAVVASRKRKSEQPEER
jgi:hypothetical protein